MVSRLAPLLALALLAGCSSSPVTGDGAPPRGDATPDVSKYVDEDRQRMQRINVDIDGVDLAEVMKGISEQVGVDIIVDENVEEVVRVSLRDIPWREAVDVIARMTRCEVAEYDGKLYLAQCTIVRLQFSRADLRTVLQLMAAYSGLNTVLSDSVKGEVTMNLGWFGVVPQWSKPWLKAIEALVRTVGLHARLEGEIITVSDRQPRFGAMDLDGDPPLPPAPPPEGPAPRNLLRARGVSLDTWAQLLASYAGKDVVIGGGAHCTVDADLKNDHWLYAPLRATSETGADVRQEGDFLGIKLPATAVRSASRPVAFTLQLPDGRRYEATVEATVVVSRRSDRTNCVVISDRIYQPGDALVDEATDEELETVTVERITTQAIGLRVEGHKKLVVVRFPPGR